MEEMAIHKAAVVLARLEPTAREAVLDRMPIDHSAKLRETLGKLTSQSVATTDSPLSRRTSARSFSEGRVPNQPATQDEQQLIVVRSDSLRDLLSHDDETLARMLTHERGSVVAAMLSSLPQSRAAGILRHLPTELRHKTLAIWDAGIRANPKIVDVIAEWICDHLAETLAEPSPGDQHHQALQSILAEFNEAERTELLRDLEQENPLLAKRLAKDNLVQDISNSSKVGHEWSC